MTARTSWLALTLALLAGACAAPEREVPGMAAGERPVPKEPAPKVAPAERRALFGDLHLHTGLSLDAYILMGTRTTLDDAYRFARGEEITYLGEPVRRREPLDFLAITDHAENLGVYNELDDPASAPSRTAMGRRLRAAFADGTLGQPDGPDTPGALDLVNAFFAEVLKIGSGSGAATSGGLAGLDAGALSRSAWRRSIAAANRYNEPGRFTAFIAYEWSSQVAMQNLHRNVIFRGDDAPVPFSSADSVDPEALWDWLGRGRARGYEALAIPHNSNASNGLMFDWNRLDGRPIDAAYASLRRQNEPLVEIAQTKGTSETHPLLSPADEFADFELFDRFLTDERPSKPNGSYVRDALGRGIAIDAKTGVNPLQMGFVGAGDLHGGLPVSTEQDHAGSMNRPNLGGGRPDRKQAAKMLRYSKGYLSNGMITASAGLTGVWAEENTRTSLYAALQRRETFATSGTRLRVRLFGGWDLPAGLERAQDRVARAYAAGVPMGGDLKPRPTGAGAPQFLVWAIKDANGANLDRIQVIKVWADARGQPQEQVFDVAWQEGRARSAKGLLAPVGNTVDAATGTYRNTIGSTELTALWRDPQFDPAVPSAYYIRALEIPTPRWSTMLAARHRLPLAHGAKVSIQERAWSSPIWYRP